MNNNEFVQYVLDLPSNNWTFVALNPAMGVIHYKRTFFIFTMTGKVSVRMSDKDGFEHRVDIKDGQPYSRRIRNLVEEVARKDGEDPALTALRMVKELAKQHNKS